MNIYESAEDYLERILMIREKKGFQRDSLLKQGDALSTLVRYR